jgi:ribosomal protein S18 acetylase RimI-like enzyme
MEVIKVIEHSLFEFSLLFARYKGGNSEDGDSIKWVKTGTNAMNRIFGANLKEAAAEEAVAQMTTIFKRVPVMWIVSPSTQPRQLGKILESHGFKHGMEWVGMACKLNDVNPRFSAAGIRIVEADNPTLLAVWAETAAAGFQMTELIKPDFVKVYKAVSLPTVHCYIGFSGTEPVAAASLNLGREAGAYFVATRPEYRGKGYARELMQHILAQAACAGYDKVVLQASQAGCEVYKSLGFKDYCRMQVYNFNF